MRPLLLYQCVGHLRRGALSPLYLSTPYQDALRAFAAK